MAYFIHNKYDKDSIALLDTLADDVTIIDFYTELENENTEYRNLDTTSMGTEVIEELKFSDAVPLSTGVAPNEKTEMNFSKSIVIKKIIRINKELTAANDKDMVNGEIIIPIPTIDPSKTTVRFNTFCMQVGTLTARSDNYRDNNHYIYVKELNTNNIKLGFRNNVLYHTMLSFELVEYV